MLIFPDLLNSDASVIRFEKNFITVVSTSTEKNCNMVDNAPSIWVMLSKLLSHHIIWYYESIPLLQLWYPPPMFKGFNNLFELQYSHI